MLYHLCNQGLGLEITLTTY